MNAVQSTLREIPLASLTFSTTGAQTERRRRFEVPALAELAESIRSVGVIQPILARPFRDEHVRGEAYEVVAGERRVLAARQAGLQTIPANVRELTDEQVLELQLVENLQREGLHELIEAEGYEALMKTHGYTVDDLVAKVGKSKAYVYARLKLTALCAQARQAFHEGKLNASTGLLVARIPGADQQLRALTQITAEGYQGRTMTYREAADYVHDTFMLKLSTAPFPRDDESLVPSAGACGVCPMRTGNQPELFGDVKGADVCTNPACFASKKAAHVKRELEKAKASGERVIRGGDARRILPDTRWGSWNSDPSAKQLRNGYARPADKCLDDPKKRTYAELAGKDAPRVLLQHPDTGRVEKVFEISAIVDRLKAKGVTPPKPAKNREEASKQDAEQREKAQELETAARRAIFQAIVKAAPTKLGRDDLIVLLAQCFDDGYGNDEDFYGALGWDVPSQKTQDRHGALAAFVERLHKVSDTELARLAVALPVITDVFSDWGEPNDLNALAKRFGIDMKKVRAELAPAKKPDAPPTPAKKAAKKK